MKILFTGASSFTGFWFVKSLAAAGHEVVCPLRGAPEHYDTVRKQRVGKLQSLCRLVPETPFGTEAFFKLICEGGAWDLLCHHATEAANYRSPDFDIQRALQNNTLNLRAVLAALKADGLKGVVLTGSVFENDEGAGEEPLRAFSGYGLSKGLTWQMFRYHCGEAHVPLGKFVIPNPFGPFEEPRFTAYLMRSWKEGKPAGVKTPDYVRTTSTWICSPPSMRSLPGGSWHQRRIRSRSIQRLHREAGRLRAACRERSPETAGLGMQTGTGAAGGFQRTVAPGQRRSGSTAGSGLE